MLSRQNVTKAKCYQGKMLPRQNVTRQNVTRQNVTRQSVTRQNVTEPHVINVSKLQHKQEILKDIQEVNIIPNFILKVNELFLQLEVVRYPCDKCEFAATITSDLRRHVENKHEGVRYSCDKCEYAASTTSYLR